MSGTDQLLQAVSPVSADIVWVSGHGGTYARTLDGGVTWEAAVMEGEEALQFRDVAAFDAHSAYLLSAGTGDLSRIYRTNDAGETWALQFRMEDPAGFLDCMDFWDSQRGLAYGDATEGHLFILRTLDGGATWTRLRNVPEALDGEGGFAASGSCVVTAGTDRAWIATGNAERARIVRTEDAGESWTVVDAPVVAGPGSGLTTIGVRNGRGFAIGGTIGQDTLRTDNVTGSMDAGISWTPLGGMAMAGPVYGADWIEPAETAAVFAVGPGGADYTFGGQADPWIHADTLTYWAVAFAPGGPGWSVGPAGRITRWSFERVSR